MAKLVSGIYAKALYEVAKEQGTKHAEELMEEIDEIRKILSENPDFDALMKHPGIPLQEKLKMLKTVFDGRISKEIEGLLEAVILKERYSALPAIFDDYTARVKKELCIGTAYVTTAVPLNDAQKTATEKRLLEVGGFQKMEMNYDVDASLVGGMVIRIGDRVVDSSIRTKLEDLKKQLLQIQLG